jgi:hypothetical protein
MHDVSGLTRFSISTDSTSPLRGVVEIVVAGSILRFAIGEEAAHRICTELERFLTQPQSRGDGDRRRI